MLLQKRTNFEPRLRLQRPDGKEDRNDPLFERDWEIFVVKRDPETGEFVTSTVSAGEGEKPS